MNSLAWRMWFLLATKVIHIIDPIPPESGSNVIPMVDLPQQVRPYFSHVSASVVVASYVIEEPLAIRNFRALGILVAAKALAIGFEYFGSCVIV